MIARKTVLRHRVAFSPMPQFVVLQTANDGKQQRRMARPCRPSLPKQFDPFSIPERAEFGARALDGGRDSFALQRMDVRVHALPRQNAVCSGSWCRIIATPSTTLRSPGASLIPALWRWMP